MKTNAKLGGLCAIALSPRPSLRPASPPSLTRRCFIILDVNVTIRTPPMMEIDHRWPRSSIAKINKRSSSRSRFATFCNHRHVFSRIDDRACRSLLSTSATTGDQFSMPDGSVMFAPKMMSGLKVNAGAGTERSFGLGDEKRRSHL